MKQSDCPQGLGGFINGGQGLRLKANPTLTAYGEDITNNLVKFLGMVITIWLPLFECKTLGLTDKIILVLGNNTCAISWIFKVRFSSKSIYRPGVLFITRKIMTLIMNLKDFINIVSSRDNQLNSRLVIIQGIVATSK